MKIYLQIQNESRKIILGILAIFPAFEAHEKYSGGYAVEFSTFPKASFVNDPPAFVWNDLDLTLSHLRIDDVCRGGYEGLNTQSAYCSYDPKHTACLYNKINTTSCGTVHARKVTDAEKTAILDTHNAKRRRVAQGLETLGADGGQPKAANMRKLTWDIEAASLAQLWADQCTFEHDSVHHTDVQGQDVCNGQNIYLGSTFSNSSAANWTAAIEAWYGEVKDYDPIYMDAYEFSPATGHYTQVVWGTTTKIGCGYILYLPPGETTIYKQFYVCNYSPGGNLRDNRVYLRGDACSECPTGTNCVDFLCA